MITYLSSDFNIAKAIEIEIGGGKEELKNIAYGIKYFDGETVITVVSKGAENSGNCHGDVCDEENETKKNTI